MRPMPSRGAARGSGARHRRLRRRAAIHRPRAEVRRPTVAGLAARRADAASGCRSDRGRGRRGSRPATSVTATRARVQPGRRSGEASGHARQRRSSPRTSDGGASTIAGRQAARQRPWGVRRYRGRTSPPRRNDSARRRCQHDRSHARCVRAHAQRGGYPRSAGAHGSACRDWRRKSGATAVNTSAAMVSLWRSPSSRTQCSSAAMRR